VRRHTRPSRAGFCLTGRQAIYAATSGCPD
jgi:hypothetical protein